LDEFIILFGDFAYYHYLSFIGKGLSVFINRCSASGLSAIMAVSSAYSNLLRTWPLIIIPVGS